MHYHFGWDPTKAKKNIRKHHIPFRRAATVFRDPNHLTLYDEEHSDKEERWITMGIDQTGVLCVVSHTAEELEAEHYHIQIISARKAEPPEVQQYQESNV